MNVTVILSGCDDRTEVEVEVTDDEKAFLDRLAALTEEASEYGCMPRLTVTS